MEKLLVSLEQALSLSSLDAIREALSLIIPEMDIHFACEEEVLFPAVSPYHPMVLMEAEHEELMALRQTVSDLLCQSSLSPDELDRLKATSTQFIQHMLDHIGREDAGIFPACEQSLSNAEKHDVIDGMENLRAKAREGQNPVFTRPARTFKVLQVELGCSPDRPLFSERLLDAENLQIKHLVIQAGHSLPAHWSPQQLTVVCLAGQGIFSANDTESKLQPGATIVMTPELTHAIRAETDCHLLLLLQDQKKAVRNA